MSPIIGLFIAIVAGWLAPRPRVAAAIVVAPMVGATAAQSWYLGSGRGHNPASTTTASVSYWVVQVLIITAICGVAAALCWLRTRRSPGQRDVPSGARGAVLLVIASVAALATTLGAMFITDRPSHPGSGNGNIPVAGAIAVVIGFVVLAALAFDWARKVRRTHRTSRELAH